MSASQEFEVTLVGDTSAAQELQDRIVRLIEEFGYSSRDVFVMRLAIEEAIVNAIKHGNRRHPSKKVVVSCQVDHERAWIRIQDEGDGFVLSDVPDPTLDENLDRASGRGIKLMQSFLTSLEYNDKGNCVTLIKNKG